jgi:N-carbamoyl-L-amino-acid hydrolase
MSGTQIGIVTAIVGISSYRLAFLGQPEHAGTASMEARLDAAQGASAFILAARQIVIDEFPGCVANVGEMKFSPGAFNIVPGRVELGLEFRAPEATRLVKLETALLEAAQVSADRFGLGLEVEFLGSHQPSPMSELAQSAFQQACQELGLSHASLPSFAGHDAQSLAGMCPVGMIFIPSVGGISHAPGEFSRWEDCLNGANVLLRAALLMAESV